MSVAVKSVFSVTVIFCGAKEYWRNCKSAFSLHMLMLTTKWQDRWSHFKLWNLYKTLFVDHIWKHWYSLFELWFYYQVLRRIPGLSEAKLKVMVATFSLQTTVITSHVRKQLCTTGVKNSTIHNSVTSVCLSHLVVRLHQHLVVLAERYQEHDGGDVLEAVDPLPPLWPLTPNIHHPD